METESAYTPPRPSRRSLKGRTPDAPPVVPTVKFTLPCRCGLPLLPGETDCPRCVHGARW